MTDPRHILTLNAGSSSLKVSLWHLGETPDALEELARGQIEGVGDAPHFVLKKPDGTLLAENSWPAGQGPGTHKQALDLILDWKRDHVGALEIAAIGHRVVHGGPYITEPTVLDDEILTRLETYVPLAPLHQPHNIRGIQAAQHAFPDALQVACFDTAFHRRHPWVNDTYALPRELYREGVRRYGFHGLSYEYVAGELRHLAPETLKGRVVIAHLGNGASLCAMENGRSIDCTLGFTALDGLAMGTRCGQLDPGVVLYLIEEKGMNAKGISDLLYKQSGLKGLSGLSHDMRTLEEVGTPEAQGAIAYFVNRIRREIGAMAALLGGLDALVFAGGIGENDVTLRARVCENFEWMGLILDPLRNGARETCVSAETSKVGVYVIPTNEEAMIAAHTRALMT
ncbi:acetate/propionate family kinase [Roseospira marina]|uniref:Acetate kinase n=1 Tax=Roseospira marina TaxID=140057 RepID=A0A5M6IF26_9PROT|nr:acetate/propionate family kinase [Roseospira marina]KAA5606547.1 acetate/propionate family kinase [Roseospira marina]MBB4314023.1 acetate kinase [Roseospira marina]MBB5087184.1 acetate kinase [Roseospira marina]